MSSGVLSRRELLGLAGAGSAALLLAGCGSSGEAAARPGSTLERTLVDRGRRGLLEPGPGLPLLERTELAPAAGAGGGTIATLAQLTDLHVHDAESPARAPFLDRLGARVGSAFRPHETLVPQILGPASAQIDAAGADAVLVSGDLVDSAQRNELDWALALLAGGRVRPDSGRRGYDGVQTASNPDPLYYRPDVDPPRHRGLLAAALAPVSSPGLRTPWHAAIGNHDVLVQGAYGPTDATRAVATGTRLVLSPDLELLRRVAASGLSRAELDTLLRSGVPGRAIEVARDEQRIHLDPAAVVRRLRDAGAPGARHGDEPARLDYAVDVGEQLVVVMLDLARRDIGSGGVVRPATLRFLQSALDDAGRRWVIVCSHQPLAASENGAAALAILDSDPRVLALLSGHTHRNRIAPRRGAGGGSWDITTCSLIDWPQQWRMLRLRDRGARGLTLETWMVDHPGRPGRELGGIARDLAYVDVQGGRPTGAAGPHSARNARLHLPARLPRAPRSRRAAPPASAASPAPRSPGLGDTL